MFSGFWHNLYIRRLPGPSPRFLLGFYPYLPRDFQDSEGKTYQKPIRKNKEKNKNHITIHLYAQTLIVVAFLVVNFFGFLVIARYHTIRNLRTLEEIFL